jgi:hypothetical protein
VCRPRQGVSVLVSATSDGTWDEPPPPTCASCGNIPEQVILVSEVCSPAGAEEEFLGG